MIDMRKRIRFTTLVLGPVAAYRLEKHQVTQTLRSENSFTTRAILNGMVKVGDEVQILLDDRLIGLAEYIIADVVTWGQLDIGDAHRGGFDTLDDLLKALKRAGYRFKPLDDYQLFRIQFSWIEEAYG